MNYGLNAGVLQQVKIVLLAPSPHDYLTKTGGPGTQFANPLLEMLGRVASSSKTLPNIEFTLQKCSQLSVPGTGLLLMEQTGGKFAYFFTSQKQQATSKCNKCCL